MKVQRTASHSVDILFPLSILFVFAVSALAVLLLSSRAYTSQRELAAHTYETLMPISYLREKVRQHDRNGAISVGELDGQPSLILYSSEYTTYLYAYDGMLKELTVCDGVAVHAKDGQDILELQTFSIQETADGLICLFCQTEHDPGETVFLAERSVP